MYSIKDLDLNFSVVSAIIERKRDEEIEVLVQTRWKPNADPQYSGTLEIPAGAMRRYENVYDALKREVFEETGLYVTGFKPDIKTGMYTPREDEAFAFIPFCCQQQTKGGVPRVGFVFLCTVEDREPRPQQEEVKEIRWVKRSELRKIIEVSPEKVFTFQLGVLDYYLNNAE